jgi:DNA-binding SARP family transcriptional activator
MKVLQLIKLLVAAGRVGAQGSEIADDLWPDREGDLASRSLGVTITRARRVLGRPDAIEVTEGRVSLNPRVCWSDVEAFDRRAAHGMMDGGETAAQAALKFYRGPLLPNDADAPWSVRRRLKLKAQFVGLIASRGTLLEEDHRWLDAIGIYERGIEADDLGEDFYLGLMRCHAALGKVADVIKVYERLKQVLAAGLGVGPSPGAMRLAQSLLPTQT